MNYELINFSFSKGDSIAFVGATGAGKTTLVDVLLGLLIPEQGIIEVNGTDIHSNIRGWWENIGYIPQNIYILDDTIKHNIALGVDDEDIDEEKLNGALQAAYIEEFINDLPCGIDTITGEQGIRLSGGQRQRIGIARALYLNPECLVMDEATASLDNVTEDYVIKALERLKQNRIVIMIAHRLSTVKRCDKLFFMKNGSIVDSGSYSELCRNNKDFWAMAKSGK